MRPYLLLIASAAAVVGLAACSSGSGSPTVARLSSAGVTTTTAPASGAGPGKSGGSSASAGAAGPGGGAQVSAQDMAKMEAYSQCMRGHGVPAFPDPVSGPNGGAGFRITGGPGTGLDPQSSTFQAADRACRSLLPNGGVAKQLTPAQQQAFLQWAQCIRQHGVPNFPDPDFSGGGVRISLRDGPGSQAALQAAQQACKSKMPAGFPAG
jgi:hypothetical protein